MFAVFRILLYLNRLQPIRAPLLQHALFTYHYISTIYIPRLFRCMKGIPARRTYRDTNFLLYLM